jgi:hypothetical protein
MIVFGHEVGDLCGRVVSEPERRDAVMPRLAVVVL